jgi:hypothetical protein
MRCHIFSTIALIQLSWNHRLTMPSGLCVVSYNTAATVKLVTLIPTAMKHFTTIDRVQTIGGDEISAGSSGLGGRDGEKGGRCASTWYQVSEVHEQHTCVGQMFDGVD